MLGPRGPIRVPPAFDGCATVKAPHACVCLGRITKWQRRRTTAALAIAHTAEEADKVLLTSMYLAIGNSLQALPSQLGQLTMWRALVQVIPFVANFNLFPTRCNISLLCHHVTGDWTLVRYTDDFAIL